MQTHTHIYIHVQKFLNEKKKKKQQNPIDLRIDFFLLFGHEE